MEKVSFIRTADGSYISKGKNLYTITKDPSKKGFWIITSFKPRCYYAEQCPTLAWARSIANRIENGTFWEKTMQNYWCVSTKFFDSGSVKAVMYQVEAEEKPKNCRVENLMCDEYHDYFDTYEEARRFWKNVQRT